MVQMRRNAIVGMFIPGGPGMNSFAEMEILAPEFEKQGVLMTCWNPPSRLRDSDKNSEIRHTFQESLDSAAEQLSHLYEQFGPIHILAHSFGANYAYELAARFPEKIASMTLIGSALCVYEALKNVIQLAMQDFKKSDPSRAERLSEHLRETKVIGDAAFIQGLALMLEDPELMTHYWINKKQMEKWGGILASATERGFDLDSFFGILKSQDYSYQWAKPVEDINIHLIFGALDPVIHSKTELELAKRLFTKIKVTSLENVSHFLHLENPEEFVQQFINSLEMASQNEGAAGLRKVNHEDRFAISRN